jgi:hypothetical protein
MKKLVFVAVILLLAGPVWALDIECTVGEGADANLVTITFSGAVDIRAFALDIELDGDGTFSDVQCLSAGFGYQVYPGDIDIDSQGNVDDWGSCKCSGSYPGTLDDSNSMTIEMGAMYEPGIEPDPCEAGDLVSFRVSGTTALPDVTIAVNVIRGGAVDEDAATVTPSITGCPIITCPTCDCLSSAAREYAEWHQWGEPDCWCYQRQCRGDIDGLQQGPFWVSLNDLNIFRICFNQMTPLPPGCECADLDHALQGPFPVSLNDLIIIRQYFNQMAVPVCDQPPIYTGPYNFWTN